MLKITKTVEYALIAIRHMNHKNKLSTSREISTYYNIPHEIMAKTLQKLCKTGYVHAIKGPHGGYNISIPINTVNLFQFIEDIEGPVGLVECLIDDNCNLIDTCNIKSPINKINNNIKNALSKISLQEIAR